MGEGARQGLHLTDGDWNKGGDPLPAAARFDKLSVIGFPFANDQKIRHLALRGKGTFAIVKDEIEIAGIMMLIRRGESCIRPGNLFALIFVLDHMTHRAIIRIGKRAITRIASTERF